MVNGQETGFIGYGDAAISNANSSSRAQTTGKPAPGFTLTLSQGSLDGRLILLVRYTNVSKSVDRLNTCRQDDAFHQLKVVFNGVPIAQKRENLPFDSSPIQGNCVGASAVVAVRPGESTRGYLKYDTAKPGTYEFTVEQGTFPDDPTKNVIVKSNTVTIVVPDPKAATPK